MSITQERKQELIKEFAAKGAKGKLRRMDEFLSHFKLEAVPEGRKNPEEPVSELHEALNRW